MIFVKSETGKIGINIAFLEYFKVQKQKEMTENNNLAEIQRLSDKQYKLFRELDAIIQSGGEHLGPAQPQVQEIHKIEGELRKLWAGQRAEGKYWLPRLREGHPGKEEHRRPLQRRMHGYRQG